MVIEQTHLSKLAKNLNTDEQNLLKVINKSILSDKTKLAKLYNVKNSNSLDKSYLKALSNNLDLLNNNNNSNNATSSTTTFLLKQSQIVGKNHSDNLDRNRLKIIDETYLSKHRQKSTSSHLLSRSMTLKNQDQNNNNNNSNLKKNHLTHLLSRNSIDNGNQNNQNYPIVRKSSIKLFREKSQVSDYYTYVSGGGENGNHLENNSNLNFMAPNSYISTTSTVKSNQNNNNYNNNFKMGNFFHNAASNHSIDQNLSTKTHLSFDNVFSNLNLFNSLSNTSRIPSTPNNKQLVMSGGKGKPQNLSFLSSKLSLNKVDLSQKGNNEESKNEIKQLLAYKKATNNNFLNMLNIEKILENDEKQPNGFQNQNQSKSNENGIKLANQIVNRPPSKFSYKSRDPNDSYAYTDVKKYIEENELMNPEKERSIQSWITTVNSFKENWEKNSIDMNLQH
jgi:hypothetical protein